MSQGRERRRPANDCSDRELLERIDADVQEVRTAIYGDDGEDKPGLKLRVDRLEQKSKIAAMVIGSVAGALVVAVVAEIVARGFGH